MNRGNITPQPQSGLSYSNPNVFAPGAAGGAPSSGESWLALAGAALLAGLSTAPAPLPNGLQPLSWAVLAAALL